MNFLWRFLAGLLTLTLAVAVATALFGVEFAHLNFWDFHGILFLLGISLFPRITLFFSTAASGGLLWWVSWIFAPRLLVAVLATLTYWHQNPGLVVLAWLVAFGGESSEKYAVVHNVRKKR